MYGIFLLLLMVGIARWLSGMMIGEEGYGEILEGYAGGLDMIFGVVGAYVGSYFFLLRSSPPYQSGESRHIEWDHEGRTLERIRPSLGDVHIANGFEHRL